MQHKKFTLHIRLSESEKESLGAKAEGLHLKLTELVKRSVLAYAQASEGDDGEAEGLAVDRWKWRAATASLQEALGEVQSMRGGMAGTRAAVDEAVRDGSVLDRDALWGLFRLDRDLENAEARVAFAHHTLASYAGRVVAEQAGLSLDERETRDAERDAREIRRLQAEEAEERRRSPDDAWASDWPRPRIDVPESDRLPDEEDAWG